MVVGRVIGWLLLVCTLAVLGRDLLASISEGNVAVVSLGELWFGISRSSLNTLQAGIERHVSVWLWDSVIFPMLKIWAFAYFLVPGLALVLLCRDSDGHNRRARRRFKRGR